MIGFFVAAVLSFQPVIGGREPRAASPWEQSVKARCGRSTVEISGYGAAKPLDRKATVRINGRGVEGSGRAQLLTDLANRRAAYRIAILCGGSQDFTIRVHVGEKQIDGNVRYWSGAVFLKGNRLVTYTGLQEGDESSFWFR